MDLYNFDVFTIMVRQREKYIPLKEVVDITDQSLHKSITDKVNGKKKVGCDRIDLELSYAKISYQQKARDLMCSGFECVAETREEAQEKAYLTYAMSACHHQVILSRSQVEIAVHKFMPNAKRKDEHEWVASVGRAGKKIGVYPNKWDAAIRRVKEKLVSDHGPGIWSNQNNQQQMIEHWICVVRNLIQVGIIIPDIADNMKEEFVVQEALGQMGVLMKNTPIKIDEAMLTYVGTDPKDIHESVHKAISTWNDVWSK